MSLAVGLNELRELFFLRELGFSQIPDVYKEKCIWAEMLMIAVVICCLLSSPAKQWTLLDPQYSHRPRVPTAAYQGAGPGEWGVRDKSTGVSRYSRDKNVSTPRGGGST